MNRQKVFGVGWAKTGTTTLGECLRLLGHSHVGGRLDLVQQWASGQYGPLFETLSGYDSAEDWPWLLMYQELDERFPGSQFILTTREPQGWLRSYRNMVESEKRSRHLNERRQLLYGFDVATATDAQLLERVNKHNTDVREFFANRPDDFIELSWEKGDGWPELSRFLKLPEPSMAFPHANRGAYRARRRAFLKNLASSRTRLRRHRSS